MLRLSALLLLVFAFGSDAAPKPAPILSRVTPNEIALYQAYLRDSLSHSKSPAKMWFVDSETWPYATETACDVKLEQQGVSRALIQSVRDLGTARYLIPAFDIGFAKTFDPYAKTVNGTAPNFPFTTQTFSRVAFSQDGKQAFFHVTWLTSAPNRIPSGTGRDILAEQQGATWRFSTGGCVEFID